MKERPILFQGEMVRALLAGTKTQTRRAVKHPAPDGQSGWHPIPTGWEFLPGGSARPVCPYGKPGDRLWVCETWAYNPDLPGIAGRACYRADLEHAHDSLTWKPSIHMPRAASRLMLELTAVRVERLQDISEADAMAEGFYQAVRESPTGIGEDVVGWYRGLWEAINGPGSWAANPWVWVVQFKVVTP